ncbi:LacI family DNA-binding transcriptional regulator [Hydrogenoanaerobacterium sp.]|uniref:LacI family DNA-binding transcriptional regulator n=1 Tax=Hydrogenoanaerobacterium sp. TaxID=2953763 RepID=UPI00289F7F58|nr:LacI family DNA-binding transcriptional regulator [Hydrogenoanaerobacterium sp.]
MPSFRKNNVTINDVAAAAKVSKTTVSRYLNGKYEFMSPETKRCIEKVIIELNYHPSNIARSLKSQKSRVIGCIIADITSHFSSILVKGVSDVCLRNGYQVLFLNVDNNAQKELDGIQSLLNSQVDGLIINTTGYNDDYIIELFQKGFPVALADRCLLDRFAVDTVTTENYHTTYDCIKHLYHQGYKRVAFFTEAEGKISSRYIRHSGFLAAMEQLYHIDGNECTFPVDANDLSVCVKSLDAFIGKYPDEPIAIFTVNGVTLLNVLNGMNKAGYEISNKLGICGFDDWGWASVIPPGITTITQDSHKVGVLCAELVIKRIKNKNRSKPKFLELPNELVIRGSTKLIKQK